MKWIEMVQTRLRMTTDVLSNMKAVKMSGLGQVMWNIIQNTRVEEIRVSGAFRRLIVATISLCTADNPFKVPNLNTSS